MTDERDRFRTRKFGDDAADVIRQMIVNGDIPIGARLNEVALSNSLGISRSPIREALNALAGEGLVVFVPGRGAFVPSFGVERVQQLGQARLALECSGAGLAAQFASDHDLDAMAALLEDTRGAIDTTAGTYPHALDFHGLVLRASGNSVIEQLATSVNTQLRLARIVSGQNPQRAQAALGEHQTILDALRRRDSAEATEAMHVHLMRASVSTMESVAHIEETS